jgi:hypothetical protein
MYVLYGRLASVSTNLQHTLFLDVCAVLFRFDPNFFDVGFCSWA